MGKIMRLHILFYCILLVIGCAACESVSIRVVYDAYEADREFDGRNLIDDELNEYYQVVDFDREVESSRLGIEAAFPMNPNSEYFVDVSHVRAEFFEPRYGEWFQEDDLRDWDIDGEEVGIGVRSLWSDVPGWGLDWGVRLKVQEIDDSDDWMEVTSYGIDANIGSHYTIPLENNYFLSPRGGLLVRAERGYLEINGRYLTYLDLDYDQESIGLYLGFRLRSLNLMGLSILANGYLGTDDLQGYFLSLGCNF